MQNVSFVTHQPANQSYMRFLEAKSYNSVQKKKKKKEIGDSNTLTQRIFQERRIYQSYHLKQRIVEADHTNLSLTLNLH